MKIIIKNLEKKELEAMKAMIAVHPENTTIEVGNYTGSISFNGLEVEFEE